MKVFKLLIIGIFLSISTHANEVILSINTGGHTANIRDIIVTKSGDIISASDDKTIRVWNSKTGTERKKY